jgi:hypothetical protein
VHVHGDATPVVHDRDGVVEVDRDLDVAAEAGLGLVDRVVDDLVDEVVQPAGRLRTASRPSRTLIALAS